MPTDLSHATVKERNVNMRHEKQRILLCFLYEIPARPLPRGAARISLLPWSHVREGEEVGAYKIPSHNTTILAMSP